MVERISANLYFLEEDEYVGPDPECGIKGPEHVRLDDHTAVGLIGVQSDDNFIEIDGQELSDFEKAVKKLPED